MISFKQIFLENPIHVNDSQKSEVIKHARILRDHIQSLPHHEDVDIGDNCKAHTNKDGSHYYYHLNNGKVTAFSHVTNDNVHKATYRDDNEDSKYIHKFMKFHAKKFGSLKTHHQNTSGAVKLWTSLIKSKPMNKSFHLVDKNNEKQELLHHKNIDEKKNSIWGPDKGDVHLEMREVK